jgi:hypothetical protein
MSNAPTPSKPSVPDDPAIMSVVSAWLQDSPAPPDLLPVPDPAPGDQLQLVRCTARLWPAACPCRC